MDRKAIGIDVGPLVVRFAVVDGAGNIVARRTIRPNDVWRQDMATELLAAIELFRAEHEKIGAAGIGLPASTDGNLARKLTEACGLPVIVESAGALATLGEAWYGAGHDARDVAGIFVGANAASGIVCDGEIRHGVHGTAGAIAHFAVDPRGPECPCGRTGCLDAYVSRAAIERDLRAAIGAGSTTALAGSLRAATPLRAGTIRDALAEGDAAAGEVIARAARALGTAIGALANLLDPEIIVVGGGLVEACGRWIMPETERAAGARMVSPVAVVEAQLGDDAGVLGAAAIAYRAMAERRPGGPSAYAPLIEWIGRGEVQVNGQRHVDDLIVRADGSVHRRRRKLSRRVHGSPHVMSADEADHVCRGNPRPRALVIGTGTAGRLAIGDDARKWLDEHGIRVVCRPSAEAIAEYRALRGPRALLLHLRD